MTLQPSVTLSSLALFVASACLQLPTVSGLSAAGGVGSGGTTATSSTGGGSTAGSGASTGTACIAGQPPQQLESCGDAGACGCPTQCATDSLSTRFDSQNRVCEAGCQSDADCNILTACVGGVCSLIACGADAGNGTYAFACAIGENSALGSCDVTPLDGGRSSLCVAGGTSDTGCNTVSATRGADGGLCLPGYLCIGPQTGTTGTCTQLCDDVTTFCPSDKSCMLRYKSPNYGFCL